MALNRSYKEIENIKAEIKRLKQLGYDTKLLEISLSLLQEKVNKK
jgi:hypothetical protein